MQIKKGERFIASGTAKNVYEIIDYTKELVFVRNVTSGKTTSMKRKNFIHVFGDH